MVSYHTWSRGADLFLGTSVDKKINLNSDKKYFSKIRNFNQDAHFWPGHLKKTLTISHFSSILLIADKIR